MKKENKDISKHQQDYLIEIINRNYKKNRDAKLIITTFDDLGKRHEIFHFDNPFNEDINLIHKNIDINEIIIFCEAHISSIRNMCYTIKYTSPIVGDIKAEIYHLMIK